MTLLEIRAIIAEALRDKGFRNVGELRSTEAGENDGVIGCMDADGRIWFVGIGDSVTPKGRVVHYGHPL